MAATTFLIKPNDTAVERAGRGAGLQGGTTGESNRSNVPVARLYGVVFENHGTQVFELGVFRSKR
jgi:hypothetical protein